MRLYTKFPEFIYEALVTSVDYENGVCSLSPLSPSLEDMISDVPLPNRTGSGNSGVFHGIEIGSRVLASNTAGNGREFTVILTSLPKDTLYSPSFRGSTKPKNTPARTIPYPELASGRIIVRGGGGNALSLMEDGGILLGTASKRGMYLKKNRLKSSLYVVAEDQTKYSNAGMTTSGGVLRSKATLSNIFPIRDVGEAPLLSDTEYHKRASELGFFSGSKIFRRSYGRKKRNPGISEHRTVINEFSTDSNFIGFDFENKKSSGLSGPYSTIVADKKHRERGSTLDLAPGELIEIIGGNVVGITGKIMDINYNTLSYGEPGNRVPKSLTAEAIENSKRISRRGIGYHFQLSTASSSTEVNDSQSNLLFDIDKEGAIKINIPKTSNTGNYMLSSRADFSQDVPDISYSLVSEAEPVPVTLRDEFGEIVFPSKNSQNIFDRETGIRFSNTDDNPYFPTGSSGSKDLLRINPTKYHNMYAAGERLIANLIDLVNIPAAFVDDDGRVEGISTGKPFEIAYPEEFFSEDEDALLEDGTSEPFPTFMSIVAVAPSSPAIYTGGDTLVAGVFYNKSIKPCSNSFKLEKSGNDFVTSIVDSGGKELAPLGGVSAHVNLEGAFYTSIGADNIDRKSILMDTQGSMISWIGKDNNGRSIITQTDGDVLLNVGGSYEGGGSDPEDKTMNIGRFELRVNVTDKQFVTSEFDSSEEDITEDGVNPLGASDIVISLSENGIVIAGMKPGLPMIIRNEDKILIESTGSDVVLKGMDVKMVDASGRTKTLKSEGR